MKTEIAKHTPTPWTVWDTHPDYYNVGPMSDPIVAAWKFPHNAIANATFIVKACNLHQEFQEAAVLAHQQLAFCVELLEAMKVPPLVIAPVMEAKKKIQDVIAKSEAKS